MNEVDIKAKQQIVEKIKSLTNILVIVSKNPTVDDLTAAIGLTALLNKLGKHATAIFSGTLPPAIAFLDPSKVFEDSVDSLRDFIIALDKEKADHLRYKIEGDSVKIFITPYHTTITSNDLAFSQGDYNVQLVLALGVSNRESLDFALASHNQVLSDAPVATFSAGKQSSELGSISWRDENASSLSEMIMSMSESLKTDKTLLDKQIATALLTGIVSSTERFSNERTSSKVMTMAAQLMAAGADQQLISARLRESHEISPMAPIPKPEVKPELIAPMVVEPMPEEIIITQPIAEVEVPVTEVIEPVIEAPVSTIPPVPAGTLTIEHNAPVEEVISSTLPVEPVVEPTIEPVASFTEPEVVTESVSTLHPMDVAPTVIPRTPIDPQPAVSSFINTLASTLNTTPVEAPELASPVGKTILPPEPSAPDQSFLSHSYLGAPESVPDPNANVYGITPGDDSGNVDIFADAPMAVTSTMPPVAPTIELPMPPTMPDFSSLPPSSVPTFNTPLVSPIPGPGSSIPTEPTDPGQFKIPS